MSSHQPSHTTTWHMSILESWKRVEKQTHLPDSHRFQSGFLRIFENDPRWWRLDQGSHVHGRIHIIEIPFVGWELSIGVHKPQHCGTDGEVYGREGSQANKFCGLDGLILAWICLMGFNKLIQLYIYPLSSIIIIIHIHYHYHPLSLSLSSIIHHCIIHDHTIFWTCHPPWDGNIPTSQRLGDATAPANCAERCWKGKLNIDEELNMKSKSDYLDTLWLCQT